MLDLPEQALLTVQLLASECLALGLARCSIDHLPDILPGESRKHCQPPPQIYCMKP